MGYPPPDPPLNFQTTVCMDMKLVILCLNFQFPVTIVWLNNKYIKTENVNIGTHLVFREDPAVKNSIICIRPKLAGTPTHSHLADSSFHHLLFFPPILKAIYQLYPAKARGCFYPLHLVDRSFQNPVSNIFPPILITISILTDGCALSIFL